MSTVGTAPAIEAPRQSSWKKWFWRSFGFGAGSVVALVALIGGYGWYSSRPKPAKPWDSKTITAKYRNVADEGDKIRINYELTNHSDEDFRLSEGGGTDVGLRIESSDLYSGSDKYVSVYFPILVPAHGQTLLSLAMIDGKHPKDATGADREERVKNRAAIQEYLAKEWEPLNGFVILDEAGRRRIELPPGWKQPK